MKRVQLVFPTPNDAWNFVTASRVQNVAIQDTSVSGLFAESDILLACTDFGAEVREDVSLEVADDAAAGVPDHAAPTTGTGESIELLGKSGTVYKGSIYAKGQNLTTLPASAIVALSNSVLTNDGWQHKVNAIYQTDNVQQEMDRFQSRGDVSHLIVLPVNEGEKSEIDKVDDLIRRYIHQ